MSKNEFFGSELHTLKTSEFPPLLSEIPDGPKTLHLHGELPNSSAKLLAVVGSRKYSEYGRAATETLLTSLRGKNISIVSGLALGIDSIAHQSALKAGLHTIAVPGSGLSWDVLYPRTHVNLGKRIIESGGALLSEFEDDFRARPESFPQRNRIMAGMSHATLVIEAGEKSGTLITARLALEYNRDVGVVPGGIFSHGSIGSNKLLREGAFPITNTEDILELLDIEENQQNFQTEPQKNLSPEEQTVFDLLEEPKTKDELLEILDLPTDKANIILSSMEIGGLIRVSGGKIMRS